jgi:hypothetical protein
VLTETLVGAHPVPRSGPAALARVSRFVGNDPAAWKHDEPTFARVSLGDAWPGISVDLAARGAGVEKIFTVAPGADATRIAVRVRGATRLAHDRDGTLVAHTGAGPLRFSAPVAWQNIGDTRHTVAVAYRVAGDRYGFVLGAHDRAHPIVIDPLLQSSYAGGIGSDVAYAVAVAANGNVYVAGTTASTNFPGTVAGAQTVAGGGGDAFVARFDRGLTTLLQATYLGGNGADAAQALALDAQGAVYVAGSTNAFNFPGTASGAQASAGGGGDAFVAKLDAGLTRLTRATYLGGNGFDQAWALAIGAAGQVFVAGSTASLGFPGTAGGAQPARSGPGDAFVGRLNSDLTALTRATYVGGTGSEVAYALALAPGGDVYVAGNTGSNNFPATAGGAQPLPGGGGDAFIARLDDGLTRFRQATFLGGVGGDLAYALAVDGSGRVFVAGDTASSNFPRTTGGAQPAKNGGSDAFVARLSAELTALAQATYLGGVGDDLATALVLDGTGAVLVAGYTRSTDFPGTANGAQSVAAGNGDAFVARADPELATLQQATYVGGSGPDQAFAVALDLRGGVLLAGGTASGNFPRTAGAAQPAAGGGGDAFVARMTASLRLVDSPAIEYWHAEWNHYFVTASEDEIAKLDAGVFAGWARTGQSFNVRPLDTTGAANVCRFFSVSFAPKSSHFYTPFASECADVETNPDWQFEGDVFAIGLPDGGGNCGTGLLPLFRLYNDGQGGAPNHRYTTNATTRADMLAQGWIAEGAGALGVIGCVPA